MLLHQTIRRFSKHGAQQNLKFIDTLRIHVRAGAGGQGYPKYGGVGGNGGNIYLVANKSFSLKQVLEICPSKRFTAANGGNSRKKYLLGEPGRDLEVVVPVGVCVKTEHGKVVGDLNEAGQRVCVAKGGKGGNPENTFLGQKGEAHVMNLDLKLIADIGLVGFPNAGKSTFLSAVSRTTPKIADYPFTTIRPQIGTMIYPDTRQITVADLPGLIEGAHVNFGMGHKFLKHVERTKLLLFMVDITGFQLGIKYNKRSAFETIILLNKELELYQPEMLDKPAVLALNKADLDENGAELNGLRELISSLPNSLDSIDSKYHPSRLVKFDSVFQISAKNGLGVKEMKNRLRYLLDRYADEELQKSLSDSFSNDSKTSVPRERLRTKLV